MISQQRACDTNTCISLANSAKNCTDHHILIIYWLLFCCCLIKGYKNPFKIILQTIHWCFVEKYRLFRKTRRVYSSHMVVIIHVVVVSLQFLWLLLLLFTACTKFRTHDQYARMECWYDYPSFSIDRIQVLYHRHPLATPLPHRAPILPLDKTRCLLL